MTILERLPHGPEAVFIRNLITRDEQKVILAAGFRVSMEQLGVPEAQPMTSWLVEVLAQATIYLLPTEKPAAGVLAKVDFMECFHAFHPEDILHFTVQRLSAGSGPLQSFAGRVDLADDPETCIAEVGFALYWVTREL